MPPSPFRVGTWNVGGLTAQNVLELTKSFAGDHDPEALQVLMGHHTHTKHNATTSYQIHSGAHTTPCNHVPSRGDAGGVAAHPCQT